MEKIFQYGENNSLLGILTEPDSSTVDKQRPMIIVLNAGLLHRIGPFRMNVELSRRLASSGYRVFRFDLAGIGDSEKRPNDTLAFKDRNLSDIGETINLMQETLNVDRFIVLGLCTGADLAHRAAVKYSQVCASILLDGYAYPTWKFYANRYGPMYYLKRAKTLLNDLSRLKQIVISKFSKSEHSPAKINDFYWELPSKENYIADMESMYKQGKQHLYIYTSGINYFNYEDQYRDSLKGYSFLDSVSVHYFKESDHLFTLIPHRQQLLETINQWVDSFVVNSATQESNQQIQELPDSGLPEKLVDC